MIGGGIVKKFLLGFITLLSLWATAPARATTYTSWLMVGDRYWQVGASVSSPNSGQVFTGDPYAWVPHAAWYESNLEEIAGGLTQHQYTLVGELERLDGDTGTWIPFSDEIRYATLPSSPGVGSSFFRWWNPNYGAYWTQVHYAQPWCWALAYTWSNDTTMYLSNEVSDTVPYQVVQSGG
jgi:hypothetical protein